VHLSLVRIVRFDVNLYGLGETVSV
jgi:hypothetical protein